MRSAINAVIMIAVFLSLASVCIAEEHDRAIGVELSLVSGVMARTSDRWTYQLAQETTLLAKFAWKDEGYREEPTYTTSAKNILGLRLKRIKLADECELILELIAKNPGDDILSIVVSGHETSIAFQVR